MVNWFGRFRFRRLLHRRRVWQYVSGRRRRVGIFIFALMVFLIGGYWYLTNDARVKRKITHYLEDLTGADVKIGQARFSLFEGIEVRNLRVRFGKDDAVPIFEASRIYILHRPWTLILRGKLVPTKVVCVGGIVRPVLDYHSGRWLFPKGGKSHLSRQQMVMFPIYLRGVDLEIVELLDGQRLQRQPIRFSASLIPDEQRRIYKILLQDKEGAIQGKGIIDVRTGQVRITGPIREVGLDKTLPLKYLEWKKRYKLTFHKPWDVSVIIAGRGTSDEHKQGDRLVVKLSDVSMELPPHEGGLKFVNVSGKVVFDSKGVEIKDLSGKIAGAETARFTFSGRYEGYEPDSPFQTHLTATNISLPVGKETVGVLGDTFQMLYNYIKPAGMLDVATTLKRQKHGSVQAEGQIDLKKASFRLPYCPIRINGVSGKIILKPGQLYLRNLRGRYNQSNVSISGRISGPMDRPSYDVSINIQDFPLTADVYKVLPKGAQKVWDELSPRGLAGLSIRAERKSQSDKTSVTIIIDLDGRASFEYAGFPYRLYGVNGRVVITPEKAYFKSLHANAGQMQCVFSGTICRQKGCKDFRIDIHTVSDLPLDLKLYNALPRSVKSAYRACRLTGRADIANGAVWRGEDGIFKVSIPMVIKSASIQHERIPYRLERVNGEVQITQQGVIIRRIVGWHGRANIGITGEVLFQNNQRRVALDIEATNLPLDFALYKALLPEMKPVWKLLTPAGAANISLTFNTTIPTAIKPSGKKAELDYRLEIHPQEARFKYKYFPYELQDVSGRVIFTPGRVVLNPITAVAGDGKVTINGTISIKEPEASARLNIHTDWIRLDEKLISALPTGMVDVLKIRPGGKVALDIKTLNLQRSNASKGVVSSKPIRKPLAWSWSGKISLDDVAMNIPAEVKHIRGVIDGKMACEGANKTLFADAMIFLKTAMVGEHRFRDIAGRLKKDSTSSVLRIDKISAKAFGGRVEGFAEVDFAGRGKYGVSLSVEDVDLAEFFHSGMHGSAGHHDIKGSLAGNIQMAMTMGQPATCRAVGRLHISRAKIYKLPILLGWLNVIYLSLPGDSAFHTGEIRYFLKGDTLIFREIYLQGSAISLLGAGTMDMKTKRLNLTFLTAPPRKLPRLSALSEVIKGISSQLMTVRVTGTLSKPYFKTQALRDMETTLRELMEPGADTNKK